ncbi:MAG: OmpA family protein [Planctomycetota bacterium]
MRMKVLVPVSMLLGVLAVGCGGPAPEDEMAKLKRDKDMIHTEYRGAFERQRKQIDLLKAENTALKANTNRYGPETSALRESLKGVAGVTERDGEVVVLMTADILFDPGKATIKTAAKEVLSKLGTALKGDLFKDKTIRVEGHTDSDPIQRAKKYYDNNWELGSARSVAVLEYLVKEGGIDPAKRSIYAATFANFKPVAPNSNKSAKSKNRRVEVVVVMGR